MTTEVLLGNVFLMFWYYSVSQINRTPATFVDISNKYGQTSTVCGVQNWHLILIYWQLLFCKMFKTENLLQYSRGWQNSG